MHSSNSNVSVADWVVVISDESKVEFQEKFLHGKVWSGNSRLNFQPHGQAENFSAHNNVLSIFELSQAILQTKCEQIQVSLLFSLKKNLFKKPIFNCKLFQKKLFYSKKG